MAKKQLAKAALDRLKRSAKDGYPIKKPKPKFRVTSSKTISKGKDYAKNVVTSPSKLKVKGPKAAKKPGFKTGVATGVATTAIASKITGDKVKKRSDQVKKAAEESYKKQKEKQKKYREKKGK